MPSQPLLKGSDFSPVFGLIDSDVLDIGSPTLRPAQTRPLEPTLKDGGVRLGSFTKLFESLGFSDRASLPPLDPESELSNSDDALLPSPTFEVAQPPIQHVEITEEKPMTKSQRRKARLRAGKELEEEQNRLRVMQETLDQIAEEHKEMNHLEQRMSLRKQLEDLAVTTVAAETPETPSKPSRKHSRSNVGAKIRPATPTLVAAMPPPEVPQTQQKKPKTPKRPSILKRPSAPQPATPQPAQHAPVVVPATEPVPTHVQYTTFGIPAPPQYYAAPEHALQYQAAQPVTPVGHHGLVPRTVRPVTLPRTASQPVAFAQPPTTPTSYMNTPMGRPALTIRSQVDRHLHLFNKLLNAFPEDRKYMAKPMHLLTDASSDQGIHVFVDASNIMIGLKDQLKKHGFHHNAYDLCFESLALLMQRRRPVAKQFLAGSHREANPLPHVSKLVQTSKAARYDTVMQEQVLIVREDSEKKRFFDDVKKMGWHKANQLHNGSGSGSDSETGPTPTPTPKTPSAPKWVEQGVDEILHLKMCQSIIDAEMPSTMVLATGDGAVAEMSDGFLAHVERALKRGWKVELVSWGQQINGGYKRRQFRAKWADQFTILELDEFLEDLIDTP
jgi:hypothetical protein